MTRPPDVCLYVFMCAFSDWQVQVAPRARSDIGGAVDTFRTIAEAHRDHAFEDHTEAEREQMRQRLERMQAPQNMTTPRGDAHLAGLLVGVPLPRWWVDR